MAPPIIPLSEKLWSKIDKSGGDGVCWPWTGYISTDKRSGFRRAIISLGKRGSMKPRFAPRILWTLLNGDIPEGLFVLHHCDFSICCNPKHLFLGTQADNMADMVSKGRGQKGESNGRSKLQDFQAREILQKARSGIMQKEIAAEYGIAPSAVSGIFCGRKWKHLQGEPK